jgi:hypothetical protein
VSYRALELPASVPWRVRGFVASSIDPYFADVHAMLRLPSTELGITAGCNFTICQALLSVVAGLSRVFLPTVEGAGAAFRQILQNYPSESSVQGAVLSPQLEELLWTTYRNGLSHSFGLNLEWLPKRGQPGRWEVRRMPAVVKVARLTNDGLSEGQIEQLEESVRPPWLTVPTLLGEHRKYVLCVEAVYWGTRCLTRTLASTAPYSQDADRLIVSTLQGSGLSLTGGPGPRHPGPIDLSATMRAVSSHSLEYPTSPPAQKDE